MNIEKKLNEIGYTLPEPPLPIATYVSAKADGNVLYVSGQGPVINGKQMFSGKVGKELTIEDGYSAAEYCALNILSQIKKAIGSLDLIEEIVLLHGFVASDNAFYDQPQVVNGASELFLSLFGEKGKHARCALGVNVLPGNIPVEIEATVKIKKR